LFGFEREVFEQHKWPESRYVQRFSSDSSAVRCSERERKILSREEEEERIQSVPSGG
jgi:hypothetical protein